MHIIIKPKALYFGTPVVLISTKNEDGTFNLAPMSSAWWLGNSCMLGMSIHSKTVENLKREGQCVLNLPSPDLVSNVNNLALLTGKNPVPVYKDAMGYRYEPSKFEIAGLTPSPSEKVDPPRAVECPVNLEGVVQNIHRVGAEEHGLVAIEVKIIRVHISEEYLIPGSNYIDASKWSPLIMNFCEFFGLSGKLHPSKLADAWFPELKTPN